MPEVLEKRYVFPESLPIERYVDLSLRHYSYECQAPAQERPYTSRPSRTQQLQNPRLMPKLSTEVPSDLTRSNGVADDILAKRDEERGRKRDLDREDMTDRQGRSPKRTRSLSSHSTNSVSTISTNRSASASPDRRSKHGSQSNGRQAISVSPPPKSRKRRYSDASQSASSYSSGARQRSRSREWTEDRNIRRRRRESSPEERGRHRDSGHRRSVRRSRSRSIDKSRIAKERRSMTPPETTHDRPGRRSYRDRESPPGYTHPSGRSRQDHRAQPDPPRERSLSPFSKRLALTQAMNHGR
ncbi:uncharacterized protein N7498_004273 [Penicillium cinerascens]|uniref:Uncharacterized protein n=1 Tax=Penicillium cinerascens TaxID=70096 RepID=A0A9W9T7Q2_9EURO|nr:uncharacterized protein N7498_004273 [Penicillium cinerascens]KAJ5212627.1 hypothetical protein N7498_004273 [Penicillium cinerascens]